MTTLGRSWNFEFLKTSSRGTIAVPTKVTVKFSKAIDPLSGMTINLTTVDQWWKNASDLRRQKWSDPFAFLSSLKKLWQESWADENIQAWEMSLNSDSNSWILSNNDTHWKYAVDFFETADETWKMRTAMLTFNKEISTATLKSISDLMSTHPQKKWD